MGALGSGFRNRPLPCLAWRALTGATLASLPAWTLCLACVTATLAVPEVQARVLAQHKGHTARTGSHVTARTAPAAARTAHHPGRALTRATATPRNARGNAGRRIPASSALREAAAVAPDTRAPSLPSVPQILTSGGSALQFSSALRGFFQQLQQREDEPGNGTVRIMQWGDSHTAADMFTGELRARMQARFGDGGVGYTYAGHPFAGYRILGSSRSQSGGWRTLGTHFTDLGDRLLGMGGVAIESQRSGDVATLDAPCLTFALQYLRQPGGGGLQVSDNGQVIANLNTADDAANLSAGSDATSNDNAIADQSTQEADTAVESPSAAPDVAAQETAAPTGTGVARAGSGGSFRYNCPAGSHHFTLSTQGGGPVRLLGTVSLQPGITWEAMGINGAEAPLILRWNQPLFQGYLAAANPALIVLAYGTNEAAARWTGEAYRETFTRLIQMLHQTSPASSILVLGPGDRSIGSTYYTTSYTAGRGHRARRVAHRVAHRVYTPYRGTDRILNAQRDVCSGTRLCAFWDWRQRQGGFGSVNRWVAAGYAQPDHTHLTGTGYRALADALAADLLSAYSAFGADRKSSPVVP